MCVHPFFPYFYVYVLIVYNRPNDLSGINVKLKGLKDVFNL